MTTTEAADKLEVKENTVLDWCKKNYIRGLDTDAEGNYIIPKSVKKPYTGSRSKGDAIYTSIVKATLKGLDVCPELYNMSCAEFEKYINQLKKAGVIDTYIDSETQIEYFCHTLSSSDFSKLSKNRIKAFFKSVKPNGNINVGINFGK